MEDLNAVSRDDILKTIREILKRLEALEAEVMRIRKIVETV